MKSFFYFKKIGWQCYEEGAIREGEKPNGTILRATPRALRAI